MKKRLRFLALIMALVVTSTACAGAKEEPAAPEPEDTAVEEVSEAPAEASAEEVKEEVKELEEPENVVDPLFTDDFDEVTDYSAYLEGSSVKSGSRIWIQGKVEDYDKEAKAITVKTKDGDWLVSVGTAGTDDYYKLVEKTVDQFVRIFGVYTGYEADYGMPSMAFQPKDFQKYAYRLESVDNNFRLTQVDYTVSIPEFDQDETFMNITYKMPSVWTRDSSESGHYYRFPEDTLASFVMYNYIENANSGFDEVAPEDILSDLADSYVADGDEVVRKQSFKLAGNPALCFEMAFLPDGFPIPMTMFCYMFIVENQYYFYGITEPYLVGETSKKLLADLLSDVKYTAEGSDGTATKADAITDSSKDAKETTDASSASSEKTDTASTEKTTAAADNTATEPAKAEAEKPAHPPKSEIEGKIFTQHAKLKLTGEVNGETKTFEDEEDFPVILITSDIVANYDEATGVSTCVIDMEGIPTNFTFTFSYNSKGNIVYVTAPFSYTTAQYTASGVMSGTRQ
ncbi:MAG: hypothetical protein IJP84_11180 [Lachnospiraceae bacterium]|nr:hypothetical protein [Clostridia bacterium]MBQ5954720.1 hypothetical protein [Bacillota bacterium]MBQ6968449.1 hypothetical protein [Lachnospiraceae bacterium]